MMMSGDMRIERTESECKIVPRFGRRKAGASDQGLAVRTDESKVVVLNTSLLRPYFLLPLHDAAKALGVCATALKKVCRKIGIKNWPYRKIKAVDKRLQTIASEQISGVSESDPETLQTEERTLKESRELLLQGIDVDVAIVKGPKGWGDDARPDEDDETEIFKQHNTMAYFNTSLPRYCGPNNNMPMFQHGQPNCAGFDHNRAATCTYQAAQHHIPSPMLSYSFPAPCTMQGYYVQHRQNNIQAHYPDGPATQQGCGLHAPPAQHFAEYAEPTAARPAYLGCPAQPTSPASCGGDYSSGPAERQRHANSAAAHQWGRSAQSPTTSAHNFMRASSSFECVDLGQPAMIPSAPAVSAGPAASAVSCGEAEEAQTPDTVVGTDAEVCHHHLHCGSYASAGGVSAGLPAAARSAAAVVDPFHDDWSFW